MAGRDGIRYKFNSVTGKNIQLSEDGLCAHRKNVRDYFDGVVYGSQPLQGACEFEVVIVKYYEKVWTWSIHIGVMWSMRKECNHSCDSASGIAESSIPTRSVNGDNHCMWYHREVKNNATLLSGDDAFEATNTEELSSINLCDLQQGARLGFQITTGGELRLFVNGLSQGTVARNVYQCGYDLYPVVDLSCSCIGVKITKARIHLFDLQASCLGVVRSAVESLGDIDELPLPERLKTRLRTL